MVQQGRKCTKCHIVKSIDDFEIRGHWCQECRVFYPKEWEKAKQAQKFAKQWYKKHKNDPDRAEQAREIAKKWSREHKEAYDENINRWRKKNSERYKEINKQSDKKHIDRVRKYQKERYRSNPQARLQANIRSDLWNVLRGRFKTAQTMSLVGCDINFLKQHLEKQFREGMTWNNYGPVWHIDHIRPCVSFNLDDPEQQKQCFHYTNLQPLFKEENLRKGGKILWMKLSNKI